MTDLEIVRTFVEQGSKAQMVAATREFNLTRGKTTIKMLGTYSPVHEPGLGGGGAEAARRSLPRRLRNAAHGAHSGDHGHCC